MASTNGTTPNDLIEELSRDPSGFDFFQAVRLIQSAHPECPAIGYSDSPSRDPIRFGQDPSLRFAPSTISAVRTEAGILRMFVEHFGFFGPNGPLPPHLTEYARDRQRHVKDPTFPSFLNIFNHRLISFFFRAWADSQMALDMDRPGERRFPVYVGSLLGIGMSSLRDGDAVPDSAKLYFTGRLATPSRSPEGLQAILQTFFGIETEIISLVGRWIDLPADCVCKLGDSPVTGCLGSGTIVGSRFWDCQLSFRIKFGPLKLADLERMLPDQPAYGKLRDWVRNYVGQEFLWDVQFALQAAQVPSICLGQQGRLGWTSWLKTTPFRHDADDLVLIPPHT